MTEAVAAAIVPSASSRQRGSEIAEFLEGRMRENHERKGKKTEAGRSVLQVGLAKAVGFWGWGVVVGWGGWR